MAPVHLKRRDNWVHRPAVNLRVNQPLPQLRLRSRRQVAKGRSSSQGTQLPVCHVDLLLRRPPSSQWSHRQAILATDGLTRFSKTTTSCKLTSGGVPTVVAGRSYSLYRLDVNDDNNPFLMPLCAGHFEPTGQNLDCLSPRWMGKISHAGCTGLSVAVSAHSLLKYVSQPKITKKSIKPLFSRSRSSTVIDLNANRKPVYDFLLMITT